MADITTEGIFSWTTTGTVNAGTVINFSVTSGASPSVTATPAVGTLTVTNGWTSTATAAPFGTNGDQIIIYQGSASSSTFIFGFNNGASTADVSNGWQTTATSGNASSNLPTGLTNGTNAVSFITSSAAGLDNYVYNDIKSGTRAALLAAIVDKSKWTGDDATPYIFVPNALNSKFTGTQPIFDVTDALPVHLLNFKGQNITNAQELIWNVANEEGFSHYEIEMSTDAKTFTKIGQVNAAAQQQYSFINSNLSNDHLYYRLKMVNVDRSFKYSNVVLMFTAQSSQSLRIYPNPVHTTFTVTAKSKITQVILSNANGAEVLSVIVDRKNMTDINIGHLLRGTYYVTVKTTDGVVTSQVQKMK